MISAKEANEALAEARATESARIEKQREEAKAAEARQKRAIETTGVKCALDVIETFIKVATQDRKKSVEYKTGDDWQGKYLAELLTVELTKLGYSVQTSDTYFEGSRGGYDEPSYPACWCYSITIEW